MCSGGATIGQRTILQPEKQQHSIKQAFGGRCLLRDTCAKSLPRQQRTGDSLGEPAVDRSYVASSRSSESRFN